MLTTGPRKKQKELIESSGTISERDFQHQDDVNLPGTLSFMLNKSGFLPKQKPTKPCLLGSYPSSKPSLTTHITAIKLAMHFPSPSLPHTHTHTPFEMFDGQPSALQNLLIARQRYSPYANVQRAVYGIAAINITMRTNT